jgi:hypothetical protein
MLEITPSCSIDERELQFDFIRAAGQQSGDGCPNAF